MPIDETQLEQLIAAAVAKAVEDTTARLTAEFDKATAGLVENRNKILGEKKALENKDAERYRAMSAEDAARLSPEEDRARLNALYPVRANAVLKKNGDFDQFQSAEVVVKRGASHAEYTASKAEAEKRGIPFRVESGDPTPAYQRSGGSKVKTITTDTTLFVNNEFRKQIGVQAAQKLAGDKRLIVFRDVEELPTEAQAKHRATLEARNPDDFMFEEGDK